MSDYDNGPQPTRPEVVNETVVVVDGRKAASGAWGLVLAVGIVAVVFGILVLANIWGSVHLVAIFAGLFLLFAGILQFFIGGGGKTGRIIAGVVAIILGVALIAWPEASVKTVAIIIGLAFLISGISVAVAAIAARGDGYGAVVGFGAIVGHRRPRVHHLARPDGRHPHDPRRPRGAAVRHRRDRPGAGAAPSAEGLTCRTTRRRAGRPPRRGRGESRRSSSGAWSRPAGSSCSSRP